METFHELNEYVNFKNINIKNFLSIGENEIMLDYSPGINIMRGVNHDEAESNGSGKSASLVDALLWCLFGKTLRKIPNANIINDNVKKGCVVTIKFEKGGDKYVVTRTIPTSLTFSKNGKLTDYPSVDQTQVEINKLINGNYDVYKNIVTFNINKTKPFASSGADDKRKLWEYILNIIIYRKMGKMVGDVKSLVEKDILVDSNKLELCLESINILEQSIKDNKLEISTFESKTKQSISNWTALINEQQQEITLLENYDDTLVKYKTMEEQTMELMNKLTPKIEEIRSVNATLKARVQNLIITKNKIVKLDVNSKCPTCKQGITEKHIKNCVEILEETIKPLEVEVNTTKDTIEKYIKQDTKIRETIRNIQNKTTDFTNTKNNNDAILRTIETYKTMIEDIEKNSNITQIKTTMEDQTSKLKGKVKDFTIFKAQLGSLTTNRDDYDICKTLLSDSGIKEYVISIILPFVNKKLEEYMLKMNTSYTVKFGDDLSENFTKVTGNNKKRKYENFSEGEKKRIDLAMLLTFIDLAQLCGTINSNLIIFDELLDSSADSTGLESFMGILHEKAHNEGLSIWIISHRELFGSIPIDREVIIERKDDISYIK